MATALFDVLAGVVVDVWGVLVADWPYVLASILAAALITTYVGTDRLAGWLRRRRWLAIAGAVLLATLTPFCSCGTTAVVLGMLAAEAPWAPIVAFMVASPLTSPSELLLSAGLFGWPFALLYFTGATALGFAAGGVTARLEELGLLDHQVRMGVANRDVVCAAGTPDSSGSACAAGQQAESTGGVPSIATIPVVGRMSAVVHRLRLPALAEQIWRLGRRIGLYFLAYSAVGYLIIDTLPTRGVIDLLGGNPLWGVPLAALLGIPIYITSEASLPMVAALLHGGLGNGPAMAFLVSGSGTSIGAITGALLIARRRVVGLVIGLLFVGAVILGWAAALTLP